jgi:serine/threonine protein phosphatase PrpC/DNA-binding response OmpR family regulator
MAHRNKKIQVTAWAVSDPGSRNHNEDAFLILKSSRQHVLVVCDGMGGHAAGEVASGLAVETIKSFFTDQEKGSPSALDGTQAVYKAIESANLGIFHDAQVNPARDGMGSTCVLALLRGPNLFLGHVGDSRAYLIRGGGIRQLTRDHSFVEEMVKAGMITPHEAHSNPQRNVILQSLGRNEAINIEASTEAVKLLPQDYVLLCSDGLTTVVADQEIAHHVEHLREPRAICEELVRLTNRRGAPDNVTVAVLRFEGEVQEGPPAAIISNDNDALELYRVILRREGYRVDAISPHHLQPLIDADEGAQPRLIVIDHLDQKPALGLDLCRELRQLPAFAKTPLVLVTDGAISINDGLAAGASRVLANTAILTELTPVVRLLMEESTPLIYILEETPGRTEALARALRGEGFLVIPHHNAASLKLAVEQKVPKMLVLDVTRGVERLCVEYKDNPATSGCPIVLTAEGAAANQREAHQLGADYYLTRPVDAVALAVMLLNK